MGCFVRQQSTCVCFCGFVFVAWFPDNGLLAYGLGSSTSEQWVVDRQETIQRSVTAVGWLMGYDSLSSG